MATFISTQTGLSIGFSSTAEKIFLTTIDYNRATGGRLKCTFPSELLVPFNRNRDIEEMLLHHHHGVDTFNGCIMGISHDVFGGIVTLDIEIIGEITKICKKQQRKRSKK